MKKSEHEYLAYVAFHPLEGFDELIYYKAGSVRISLVILVLWFLSKIIEWVSTGFIHNYNNVEDLNLFYLFIQTVIFFTLGCISNWAFCTLMDGKGTFRNIWISCSYALLPMILCTFIATVASNFLAYDEGIFWIMIINLGNAWSIWLIICAIRSIHDYSFGKTLMSLLLTVVGIGCICFVLVLTFSLYRQVIDFVRDIYSEILFRLK